MWPHSGVDLGPIKMANIPDERVVSKIVDCCQIDDVNQSCEYQIIYLSFFLKRCLIIESILILSRIQQVSGLFILLLRVMAQNRAYHIDYIKKSATTSG